VRRFFSLVKTDDVNAAPTKQAVARNARINIRGKSTMPTANLTQTPHGKTFTRYTDKVKAR
jgi:hypothetical protein